MFFNASEMWSGSNGGSSGGSFRGTGYYLNSVDDQFSLGADFYYDGVNSQLGLEGELLMDTGSEITNAGSDYQITDQGIGVAQHSGTSVDKPKAFHIYDGFNQVTGSLWGTSYDDTIRLVSENALVLEAKSGDTIIGSTTRVQVSGAPFKLPHYTDSTRPTQPEEGDVIYNTTINRAEVWNGSTWADMSQ